jgi:hypothetical protein
VLILKDLFTNPLTIPFLHGGRAAINKNFIRYLNISISISKCLLNFPCLEKNNAEISAAVRSLKTNLCLCATFVFAYSMFAFLPDILIVLIVSVMKGTTPILTAIVNFGKLQNMVKLYWENIIQLCRKSE